MATREQPGFFLMAPAWVSKEELEKERRERERLARLVRLGTWAWLQEEDNGK